MARSKASPKEKLPRKQTNSQVSSSQVLKNKEHNKPRKMTADTNFRRYILKVLRQIYPERDGKPTVTISKQGMTIVNDFMNDVFQRLARDSSELAKMDRGRRNSRKARSILNSRHIQTATRFALPGELSKHAVSEGTKAVKMYYSQE